MVRGSTHDGGRNALCPLPPRSPFVGSRVLLSKPLVEDYLPRSFFGLFGERPLASPPPGYSPPGPSPPPSRPIGVTLLAVLTILLGVLIVGLGLLFIVAPLILVGVGLPLAFGLAAGVIGAIVLVFGLIWIGVGVGLLHLRGWAWWLAVIVMVLSIVGSFASPITAVIPALILIYLIVVRHHFR